MEGYRPHHDLLARGVGGDDFDRAAGAALSFDHGEAIYVVPPDTSPPPEKGSIEKMVVGQHCSRPIQDPYRQAAQNSEHCDRANAVGDCCRDEDCEPDEQAQQDARWPKERPERHVATIDGAPRVDGGGRQQLVGAGAQALGQELVDDLRVGLVVGGPDHLADEIPEQRRLALPVLVHPGASKDDPSSSDKVRR